MKILVIGDSCVDQFIYGECKRICPEAPVPVFNPVSATKNEGMARNVANNIRALGVEVDLITNEKEIVKTRYVDEKSNQMLLRVDKGDKVDNTFDISKIDLDEYLAVVVSDYDKGFLTCQNLVEISGSHSLTFLDTKKVLGKWASGYSFIKINAQEYGHSRKWSDELSYLENRLIVTMSEKGAIYKGEQFPVDDKVSIVDVSGAGDTFLAALVTGYLKTTSIRDAIKFANECASKVVARKGVSVI